MALPRIVKGAIVSSRPALQASRGESGVKEPGAVRLLITASSLLPIFGANGCLLKNSFGQRPIDVTAMGIRNGQANLFLYHEWVFAALVRSFPPEFAQPSNEFGPLNGPGHRPSSSDSD